MYPQQLYNDVCNENETLHIKQHDGKTFRRAMPEKFLEIPEKMGRRSTNDWNKTRMFRFLTLRVFPLRPKYWKACIKNKNLPTNVCAYCLYFIVCYDFCPLFISFRHFLTIQFYICSHKYLFEMMVFIWTEHAMSGKWILFSTSYSGAFVELFR